MRILIVTSFPYPHLGGISTHIRLLESGLKEAGHEVTVLHPLANLTIWNRLWKEMRAVGLEKNPLIYYEAAQASLVLQFILFEHSFDVVHAQDFWAWNALADVIPPDTPFLLTQHTISDIRREMPNLSPELVEYTELCRGNALVNTDVLIGVGDGVARDLECISGRTVTMVKPPVDLSRFSCDRSHRVEDCRAIGLDPEKIILFSPYRMEPGEGHCYLIEAVAELLQTGWKNVHLIIAGSGRETNSIQDMVQKSGLTGHITLIDEIPWERMPHYYRASHLYVMASTVDSVPYSLLEAMASGLPVVAVKCRGVDAIVQDGVNGLVIPECSGFRLAEAIATILDNPERYEQMSKAAQEAVASFDVGRFISETLAIYQKAQPQSKLRHRVREYTGRAYLAIRRVASSLGLDQRLPVPLRVLIASLDYPRMGGVTSHIRKLVRGLRRRGVVVDVVYPSGYTAVPTIYRSVHWEMDASSQSPRQSDVLDVYWDEQALDLQIQVSELQALGMTWDVVHCHDVVSASRLMACLSGIPFICTIHGPIVEEELAKGHVTPGSTEEAYLRELEALAMERSAAVFVVGRHLRELLARRYPRAPLIHVPNWLDPAQFRPLTDKKALRRKLGLPEDEFLVLCPSRMDFNKGVEYLIQAADRIPGTVVLIRSHSRADEFIRQHAKGGRILCLEPLDVSLMPELYNAVDVCVVPSVRVGGVEESFGLVALEAIACGVPLVATAVGGLAEILAQVGIDPIAERSPEAIVERILAIQQDPEAVQRAAQQARERLLQVFSEDVVVDQIVDQYRQVRNATHDRPVLPYRSLKAHLGQILWLLKEGRQEDACKVFRQRSLTGSEHEYLKRYLGACLDAMAGEEHARWYHNLSDWLRTMGFSPYALTLHYEPVLPPVAELVHDLAAKAQQRRLAGATGVQQVLVPRDRENGPLHVVYVMTHVQLTGGARVILDHAHHLMEAGIRVTVVSHYPPPDWYPVRCEYVQVPFQVDLASALPLCDVIVATYWDHIQTCVDSGIAPVVYFEQGDFHLFEPLPPDLEDIIRKQIQSAARVITCSNRITDILRSRYGREVDGVFYNAVDQGVFYPSLEGDRSGRKPYIMMMGSDRLAFKGTTDVLRAYEMVREAGYDVELVWVTPTPPLRPVGKVYVRPDQTQLADLYRGAAVFVSGSHYETFSLPPLEAMACGCPVVSTANEGVLTYAVDGENCLLAEVGNPQHLAQQIIRLLSDPTLRKHLRENGLRTAARFNWAETTRRLQSFYAELSQYRPAPRNQISDWRITRRAFLHEDGVARLERLLYWTDADAVEAPVIRPAFEGHAVARWERIATRKRETVGKVVRLWSPVQADTLDDLPYVAAYRSFSREDYDEAMRHFLELYKSSQDSKEKAVYLRWIVLCLIELGRDDEARLLCRDAIRVHEDNTDLTYLRGIVLSLQGRWEEAKRCLERVLWVGESASYPEFFWDLPRLAIERLQVQLS